MSSLLPRSHREFQLKEYWDTFFTRRSASFEWYGEYIDLCHVIHRYLKAENRILVVGCGNSKLSEDLHDGGCHSIYNIDISEVVVKQMRAKNKQKRPEMNFSVMDVLNMTYEPSQFDCVLDKGTLDAIFVDQTAVTLDKVDRMFAEVSRVLKPGGRYLCITLAQEHIRVHLLEYFSSGWVVRVHKMEPERKGEGVGSNLPIFVFVLTKMMKIPGRPPIQLYEYVRDEDVLVRCKEVRQMEEFITGCQQYALIRHHMSSMHTEDQLQLDLWSSDNSLEPRFTLRVVDLPPRKAKSGKFAVFIVPQGRETDWLFSSESGSIQLAQQAGFERLVVVTLHRGHKYQSMELVKEEVSAKALELTQDGLPMGRKWPVLTLGEGLGSRQVLFEASSPVSGKLVVEESEEEHGGGMVRRLVFLCSPHLSQTEVRIVTAPLQNLSSGKRVKRKTKSKKAGPVLVSKTTGSGPNTFMIDHTQLVHGYQRAILSAFALCGRETFWSEGIKGRVLIVGLGGGALPMYIHKCLPQLSVEVVELDPMMVEVATNWFGFEAAAQTGNRASGNGIVVHVQDGVEFVSHAEKLGKKGWYDIMILDVDSKAPSVGITSPPLGFVTKEFLSSSSSLLSSHGVFVTNLAARNQEMRSEVLFSLRAAFPMLISIPVPEDLNEVVVGLICPREELRGPAVGNESCDHHIFRSGCGLLSEMSERTGSADSTRSDRVDVTGEISNRMADIASVIAAHGNLESEQLRKEFLELFSGAVEILYHQSVHECP